MKFCICANNKEFFFSKFNKFYEVYSILKAFNVTFEKVGFYDKYECFYALYIED